MRALVAIACATLLLATGCLQDTGTPSDPKRAVDDTYRVIAQGSQSAIHTRETAVAETAEDFAVLWARHTGNTSSERIPNVDFKTHRVLAFFAGESFTACHRVRVVNVSTDTAAEETTVTWTVEPPAEGTGCTKQIAQPFLFVAVRQQETDLRIESDLPVAPAKSRVLEAPLARETGRRYALYTDPASWQGAMERDQAAPDVDFGTEQVLVAYMGERGNGCYHVALGNVTAISEGVRVDVIYHGPGPEAFCTQAIVYPTLAVAIPAGSKVFVEEHFRNLSVEAATTPDRVPGATLLAQGEAQGIDDQRIRIITTEADWAALWEEAEMTQDRHTVDFSANRVLAIFMGADTACQAAAGLGAAHRAPSGKSGGDALYLDVLLWNAPPEIQCIRGSPHPAAFYEIPAGPETIVREITINGLPR
ncbi:MAG TPA: protease complex subunit PrcB family protein [Candidatus Thermoplasmatota archaeon]|nr:protease complex subunit PrcB family protein [Candidatus Thermoplasmatota archaeon]